GIRNLRTTESAINHLVVGEIARQCFPQPSTRRSDEKNRALWRPECEIFALESPNLFLPSRAIRNSARRLLKLATDFGGVGVGKVRPLDHQKVDPLFRRVDPRLGAIGTAVAKRARRELGRQTLWLADDAPAQAPAIAGREASRE